VPASRFGVFMDEVIGTPTLVDKHFCHNYYERTPLDFGSATAFADRMSEQAIGIMISSHSAHPNMAGLQPPNGARNASVDWKACDA
jgi:hypothetical protein